MNACTDVTAVINVCSDVVGMVAWPRVIEFLLRAWRATGMAARTATSEKDALAHASVIPRVFPESGVRRVQNMPGHIK